MTTQQQQNLKLFARAALCFRLLKIACPGALFVVKLNITPRVPLALQEILARLASLSQFCAKLACPGCTYFAFYVLRVCKQSDLF